MIENIGLQFRQSTVAACAAVLRTTLIVCG
jgi:hypothetical protein